ncbi:hypothetical protein PWT90_09933 [Aphanocladium album]|nr:hypothetical protein PWT90_09933 [Aphanocladium album]
MPSAKSRKKRRIDNGEEDNPSPKRRDTSHARDVEHETENSAGSIQNVPEDEAGHFSEPTVEEPQELPPGFMPLGASIVPIDLTERPSVSTPYEASPASNASIEAPDKINNNLVAKGDEKGNQRAQVKADINAEMPKILATSKVTRESFAKTDPGTGYPSTMPEAVPAAHPDATVFPLRRRPILTVPANKTTIGTNLTKEEWQGGDPHPVGFSACSFEHCDKFHKAKIDNVMRKT